MKSVFTRFVFAFTTILLVNASASSKQLPADFMIDSIEGGDEIMTPLYRNRPAAVAFMTQWQSPFNPFFGDVAYKRRAMIGVIIDLITWV